MSTLIDNAFVYGDICANDLIALISPNRKAFDELTRQLNKYQMTIEEKCLDKQIEAIYFQSMIDVCKQSSLATKEIPKRIRLVSEIWSPDNDLLTASMKLKRQNIMKKYSQQLSELSNGRSDNHFNNINNNFNNFK